MAGIKEYTHLKYHINDDDDDDDDDLLLDGAGGGDGDDDVDDAELSGVGAMHRYDSRLLLGPTSSSGQFRADDAHSKHQQHQPQHHHQYHYVNSERDFTLPLQKHKNVQSPYESPDADSEVSMRRYIGLSVGLVSLITENLLSHPFVVLRRQCQVHHAAQRNHLVPVTLLPVIVHLHQRQGVTTLWKGLGSCLLVRGVSLAVEDVITKCTLWPKEVHAGATLRQFGQHLLLKCVSLAVVLPFYAASLVETVQSDIASEKPGVFDVFREGVGRVVSWSAPAKGRMLPMWALLGPAVGLGVSKYVFGLAVKGISSRVMHYRLRHRHEQRGARPRDHLDQLHQDIDVYSTLFALISTECLFYPLETILHRIQLQGTRTIIDNLDTGYSVVPILTSYEGALDCYRTTLATEGVCGLYKGFGALLLQFAAHLAVIKITKWVVTQIAECYSNKPSSRVAEFYNLGQPGAAGQRPEDVTPSATTTISRSLSSQSVE